MEKKYRKLFSLFLALVMLLFTACSGDSDVKQPANVNADSSVTANEGTNEAVETDNTATEPAAVEVTIEETVLYDADDIKITATGFENGWMGPEIKLLLENNSSKNILVTSDSASINGYMMPLASLYAEVAAGKKANESFSFSSTSLEQAGIETIADIQFKFAISDGDTWETLTTTDLITLSTSAAGFTQPVDDTGDVVFEEDGIKIVCKGLKKDLLWDGTVVFYMENNSGKPISTYAENISVNGFMVNASLWSNLRDGTRIIDGLSILDISDLGIESIDEVKNIEFNLRIVHAETWDEIKTTDVIALNFE